jgi:hypothetical protein
MKRVSQLTACLGTVCLSLFVVGCTTSGTRPSAADALPALPEFCADVQRYMADTRVPVENVVHTEYDAFVLSKAQIRPLRTEQYHWYEDEAKTRLKMISCKMKTADHIRSEYGADAAGIEGLCAGYNRLTLQRVLARMSREQRSALAYDGGLRVVFDGDEVTTQGPEWLAPYPMAYVGEDQALHIKAKAMRNDWLDQRYKDAPVRFRGTRYCHLVAPEHLERLLRGSTP